MTKSEVRLVTMADFAIEPGMRFLDIGSGTGSIAISAASLACVTDACECKTEAIELIRANSERFGVAVNLIEGRAPECLEEKVYDRIFIGGSRGALEAILDYSDRHLRQGGILGANFVKIENLERTKAFLKARGYRLSVKFLAVSREDHLGILRAENGIFLVKGAKQ